MDFALNGTPEEISTFLRLFVRGETIAAPLPEAARVSEERPAAPRMIAAPEPAIKAQEPKVEAPKVLAAPVAKASEGKRRPRVGADILAALEGKDKVSPGELAQMTSHSIEQINGGIDRLLRAKQIARHKDGFSLPQAAKAKAPVSPKKAAPAPEPIVSAPVGEQSLADKILQVLRENPNSTGRQVSEKLGLPSNSVTGRISQLKQEGRIVVSEIDKSTMPVRNLYAVADA